MGFKLLTGNTPEEINEDSSMYYTTRHRVPLDSLSEADIEMRKNRDIHRWIEYMFELGYFRQEIINPDENGFIIRTEFMRR